MNEQLPKTVVNQTMYQHKVIASLEFNYDGR